MLMLMIYFEMASVSRNGNLSIGSLYGNIFMDSSNISDTKIDKLIYLLCSFVL